MKQEINRLTDNSHQEKQNKKTIKQLGHLINEAYKLMNSDPELCIEKSREILLLAKEIKSLRYEGLALMHIGLGYFHKGEHSVALENYFKAEPLLIKDKSGAALRGLYNNIGVVYREMENYDKVMKYYKKNLSLETEYPNIQTTTTMLSNLGLICERLNDNETAMEYYLESLNLAIKNNFPYGESFAAINIALLFRKKRDFDNAHKYFKITFKANKECNDKIGLATSYQSYAYLLRDEQKFDEAIRFLDFAYNLAKETDAKSVIVSILITMASINLSIGNIEKQMGKLKLAYEIAKQENFRNHLVHIYKQYFEHYEIENDYKEAFYYYRKMQKIKDDLFNEQKVRTIAEINSKLLVQKKKHEAEVYRLKTVELSKRVDEEIKKREKQQQIIIQKSKLESLGQLAAGIAHEINQPLGLINIAIQNLFRKFNKKNITDEYLKEKSEFIDENIKRISQIIEHIRLFSRDQQDAESQRFSIADTINDALSMIQAQCKSHNINIVKEFDSTNLETIGNKYRLEQVILNLLSNSKDALSEKFDEFDDAKQIVIRLKTIADKIIIEVEDNGIGFDAKSLKHAFEPFYTTKDETKGTGLGLSICYGIINEMEGEISINSKKGFFTIVTIELQNYFSTI